jgi:hypothetical protein
MLMKSLEEIVKAIFYFAFTILCFAFACQSLIFGWQEIRRVAALVQPLLFWLSIG